MRAPTADFALGAALLIAVLFPTGPAGIDSSTASPTSLDVVAGERFWSEEEPAHAFPVPALREQGSDEASPARVDAEMPAERPALQRRIESWPEGVTRDEWGEVSSIFGFAAKEARDVLQPVSREWTLPSGYWPADLVPVAGSRSGVLVRRVALADLQDLLGAARGANLHLTPVSGFRSYATQATLFDQRARERLARAGGQITLEEARQLANAGTALPGQSQHQLGTAVDFSTPQLGYRVTPQFAETAESRWLRDHAADYGFVFPYTQESRPLTGYIAEPWHLRWVGRSLAAFLVSEEYLTATDVTVDTYLQAIQALAD